MEDTGSQELLQNLLTPDSRTRLLHRVRISTTTAQQRSTENTKTQQQQCHLEEAPQGTMPNAEPMISNLQRGESSTSTTTPTITSQELIQNLLSPESRTRLLHRNSTRIRRSNMTIKQRATENTKRREKRHIREDQQTIASNVVTTRSTFERGESSTSMRASTIAHAVAPINNDTSETENDSAEDDGENDVNATTRTYIQRNCARNFYPAHTEKRFELHPPTTCPHCHARLFQQETSTMCCNNGRISLLEIPVPTELLNLYTCQSEEGQHFRQHLRAYNHVFSFTSLGVTLDNTVAPFHQGIYSFRAHGSIYHRIGNLNPNDGLRPRFLQLFIYDTEHETANRLQENNELRFELIQKITRILDMHNPYVSRFRQLSRQPNVHECKFVIKERPSNLLQYNMPSASQVAAILVGQEEGQQTQERDIIIQTTGGYLQNVREYSGYYDPLQYPLLLPMGTFGWSCNLHSMTNSKITCCDYYSYMLQIRLVSNSILLRSGRLLQQYVVDNYVKIETQKFRFIRSHQSELRAELYSGLQDCFSAGENNAGNVGKRTILPSSFNGSPRDMYQRYQDAMAIVHHSGKPDLFITMTCNPGWKEIKDELMEGQTSHDRPDLITRIFRSKYEELKKDIFHRGVLGKVVGHVHVIEFQKRGLPHVHMLVLLDPTDKLSTPDEYDSIVRAEIPYRDQEPALYEIVIKHMIHGPCGPYKPNAQCMKNHICSKKFPKHYANETIQGSDAYPVYRRRNDNRNITLGRNAAFNVDNRWVVPYNPWLLLKYDCHLNVEICSSINSIKYLYKYVYKGPDQISFEVRPGAKQDEINNYVDGRWICPPESLWRMFKFQMSRIYPSVERLQIHLPNRHQIQFSSERSISSILMDDRNSKTMLTEFFSVYNQQREQNLHLYRDFPKYYRWFKQQKIWRKRIRNRRAIGRIYSVPLADSERYFLRMLLNHVPGPKSFDYLLTVNGTHCITFKNAAQNCGLLEHDNSIRECLLEARIFRMPSALRRLFATILVFCEPADVRSIWDENYASMIEDYPSPSTVNEFYIMNKLLHSLNDILQQHKRSIKEFDLPPINESFNDFNNLSSLIEDELSIPITRDDLNAVTLLNEGQSHAYKMISDAIKNKKHEYFFVDGPGGTGKTYLYRAILATFRKTGCIIIATATSGIAATLLPGGRTAHSKLQIPIKLDYKSFCGFKKQSDFAEVIRQATAIIWDEAPMADRKAFETVDRSFRDVTGLNEPFGGKIIIMGGDFRQVLPVVVNGTRAQIINASIVQSDLWSHVKILTLTENMRAKNDSRFSEYLLRVGNGLETTIEDDMIRIPDQMAMLWDGDKSINDLINITFPDLSLHVGDISYIRDKALLTPLNEHVNMLNNTTLLQFPGEEVIYYSYDSVVDDRRNLYQPEFLNSLTPGNLPPHKLRLKIGAPIMLLRNIDPKIGLCNGTRLICRRFAKNIIEAEILTGHFQGNLVFLPRIPLKTAEDIKLPFQLTRKQFPIRLSFALTINKSQGQTIENVGIYLPNNVFSHGQLYVALSRGVSREKTKILIKNGRIDGHEGIYTMNVVYKEIFAQLRQQHTTCLTE